MSGAKIIINWTIKKDPNICFVNLHMAVSWQSHAKGASSHSFEVRRNVVGLMVGRSDLASGEDRLHKKQAFTTSEAREHVLVM